MTVRSFLKRVFGRKKPLPPGMHHFYGKGEFEGARFHIRIEPGGKAVLIINAARVLHLNATAAEYALAILSGKNSDEVMREIRARYRVGKRRAAEDEKRMRETITALVKNPDICPISYLDVEVVEPFTTPVSAPYRMDLALTYRCNDRCLHCYVGERAKKEMKLDEWLKVIDKLHGIGVPHIVFTGGEPTLYEGLEKLIERAEKLGIVTGLNTNGRKLADRNYLNKLVEAGLDHVQITVESADREIHNKMVQADAFDETIQGLKNALDTHLYVLTNTTITKLNKDTIEQTVKFLHGLGVKNFACNGLIYSGRGEGCEIGLDEKELIEPVMKAKMTAISLGMRFIWYTPTQYCNFNPVTQGVGAKQCSAAKSNMCIEPDGAVIPCQSYYESVGNILKDPWEKIWNAGLCREIRERGYAPDKCRKCPDFNICGAGCPLYLKKTGTVCQSPTGGAV
ncbi:MAG: radical SAM protein [Thermoplasmata archaeon]|nr:radical SAM protein [Thermoplasmata archaeon]